ncbi:methionine--tRNA ligase [Nocardia aurea]|uniref:methionine--tRNA ligase n=1 Tax=Nocardia aurea TaxID=2144174 RepID=UPI0033BBBCE6
MGEPVFAVTSAIAYGSGPPHLGQAYQYIFADATARFHRLDGYRVLFSGGMDENGMKVPLIAAEQGITENDLIDRTAEQFRQLASALGISCDRVVRTAGPEHRRACTDLWTRMANSGDIYLDDYSGWYSARTDLFHPDGETTSRPDGVQVVRATGHPVVRFEQPLHFFRLSKYRDRLLAMHESDPDLVGPPSRRAEIVAEIAAGLSDFPISCSEVGWGVPVPDSPRHRIHVWFDALASYLTALRGEYERVAWPPDLQITSRGSIRFHAIHWPAFLMSAGLRTPARIFGHGLLLSAGRRMSRQGGTLPGISELISEYGADATRLFALRHGPFGLDGEFSTRALVRVANHELADGLGELARRCAAEIAGHSPGEVPECGPLLDADTELLTVADGLLATCRRAYRAQSIHRAMEAIGACVFAARVYLEEQTRSSDRQRTGTVLYVTVEILRIVGILLQPAVPETAGRLLTHLGRNAPARTFAALSARIEPGTRLTGPVDVFLRIGFPGSSSASTCGQNRNTVVRSDTGAVT